MTAEIALAGEARTWNAGLLELLVLESIDGERDIPAIAAHVSERTGRAVETGMVGQVVGRLAVNGIVQRDLGVETESMRQADARSDEAAKAMDGVERIDQGLFGTLSSAMWKLGRRLPTVGIASVAAGAALAAVALFAVNADVYLAALRAVRHGRAADAVIALVACLAWQLLVIVAHEFAHGLTFSSINIRRPVLALTKVGRRTLPNTQLDGLWLVPSTARRLAVVAVGPLISISSAIVPAAVLVVTAPSSLLADWAVFALSMEILMAVLNLGPFRYSDGTRLIESWARCRNLPALAVARVVAKQPLRAGVPRRARRAIAAYLPASGLSSLLLLAAAALWVLTVLGVV
ncbi:MAG: hypothetical protein LBS27_04020 [Bifidobacteriaceae bacterium]|jgi:hypothetical protein|nr:hypothetical protein [Bifidobacteriaceae bacterium]